MRTLDENPASVPHPARVAYVASVEYANGEAQLVKWMIERGRRGSLALRR